MAILRAVARSRTLAPASPEIVVASQRQANPTVPEKRPPGSVIAEGTHKGRKWRRFENGTVEGELLSGRFKEFGDLDEFQRFIA
jgi:hypothetical protein